MCDKVQLSLSTRTGVKLKREQRGPIYLLDSHKGAEALIDASAERQAEPQQSKAVWPHGGQITIAKQGHRNIVPIARAYC